MITARTTTASGTEIAAAPHAAAGRQPVRHRWRRPWRTSSWRERWTASPVIGFGSLVTTSVLAALLWLTTCYPLLSVLEDLVRGRGLLVLFSDLPSAPRPALPDGVERVAALAPDVEAFTSSRTFGHLTALSPAAQLSMGVLISLQICLIGACGILLIRLLAALRPDRAEWWRLSATRCKRLIAAGTAAYGLSAALAVATGSIAAASVYPAGAPADRQWFITLPTKSPDPFLAGLLILVALSHVLSALYRVRERATVLEGENAELAAQTEGLV